MRSSETETLVEPIDALVFGSGCHLGIVWKLHVGADGKAMSRALVDVRLALGFALLGFHC